MTNRLLLVFFLCFSGSLFAEDPAGAVLYFRQGKEVYLLMADHNIERGWAAFGGGANPGETVAQTAARETEEETRGYFKREFLLPLLEKQTPQVHGNFHMYFLEIDFVPLQRILNEEPPAGNGAYTERGPYAWIPYSELRRHYHGSLFKPAVLDELYLPKVKKTNYVWPLWLAQMWHMEEQGILPWLENRVDEATDPR